jgi:predicted nucleic acid-binding protein
MSSTRPRVVFDCNVFLQAAARESGPAAECLRLVERGYISLFISKPILREVRQILSDAVVRSKNLGLADEVVAAFLRKITYGEIWYATCQEFSSIREIQRMRVMSIWPQQLRQTFW